MLGILGLQLLRLLKQYPIRTSFQFQITVDSVMALSVLDSSTNFASLPLVFMSKPS